MKYKIKHSIIKISILLFSLYGCIPYTSDYPITKKGAEKIEKNLIGEWNIKSELGIYKIFISRLSDMNWVGTYYRLYEKNNQITNLNTGYGFISKINNVGYLNVQLIFGDTLTKNKYVFFKYNIISNDTIELFCLSGLKFETKFNSSNEFEKFITVKQDSFNLFFEPVGFATREINNAIEPQITSLAQSIDFISPTIFPNEVKDAFTVNKNRITDAISYFRSIVPKNFDIYIEFIDYQKIDFWVFKTDGKSQENIIQVWNTDIHNKEIQNVMRMLDWNDYEIIVLREKIYDANCISISNSKNETEVGYKRSGMGKYNFEIFEVPIPYENWKNYNDSCTYLMIDSLNVIEYGGPAFGSQCMPKQQNE